MKGLILAVALALGSCATQLEQSEPSAEKRVALSYRSTMDFLSDPLTIGFSEVVGDARCPTGINCHVAGHAMITVTLTKTGFASETHTLTTPGPGSMTYQNYVITLEDLKPLPTLERQPQPSEYVAFLLIRRVGS